MAGLCSLVITSVAASARQDRLRQAKGQEQAVGGGQAVGQALTKQHRQLRDARTEAKRQLEEGVGGRGGEALND